MRNEGKFKTDFIRKLEDLFPGCICLKNDANYMQGIPDLLMLWENKWAMFETKRKRPTRASDFEPNQEYYLDLLDSMSFAACVYPENEKEVLDALESKFAVRRKARVSQR